MARFRHLPIWKDAMGLALHLENAVRRFPRHHNYTLGGRRSSFIFVNPPR